MGKINLYNLWGQKHPKFNYCFDKITCFFKKDEFNQIKNPKSILLIRNDHLGDMVYSIPVFRELKKAFPKAKISVLATRGNGELIEKDKNIDEIIKIDLFWRRGLEGFKDYFKVLKKIKEKNFDVGIDLRGSKLNMFFFLFLPRIKNRIAYYNLDGGRAFLTHPILYDKRINFMKDHHTNLIEKVFGLKIENQFPEIAIGKEDKKEVVDFLKKNKIKKYVVFAPGATTNSKKWPEKKFDELIERFHKKYPKYSILIAGAKGDTDLIKRLYKNRKYCFPLINFNLRGMYSIYKNADVVIAHDGVGTDLSWISGGKLIELAGPVDVELYHPLKNAKVIHHRLECHPCDWTKECEMPCGKWCMDLITVEEVMKEIDILLSKEYFDYINT